MDKALVSLIICTCTYAGIAVGGLPPFLLDRTGISLLGAIAITVLGLVPIEKVFSFVDISTIILLYGLMVVSSQFRIGGFYTKVAEGLAGSPRKPENLLLVLMLASAGISAFLTNDIVCFAFTPIVAISTLKAGLNPVPFLLGIVFASNIGSAATLIGNPQNILIGQKGNLPFLGYTVWVIVPVVLGLLIAYVWVLVLYKGRFKNNSSIDRGSLALTPYKEVSFDMYQTTKGIAILLVLVMCFLAGLPRDISTITAAAVLMCSRRIPSRNLLGFIDWHLLTLLISLFIITGTVSYYGFPEKVMGFVSMLPFDILSAGPLIVLTTVLSNLFSNVPAVMLMLHNLPFEGLDRLYGLAAASTFAGNFIPLSSIANLIVIEQSAQFGVNIRFKEYVKAGVPLTILTLMVLWIWMKLLPVK